MARADVIVIGGGAAGVAAALSATAAGGRARLIRRAPGATSLSSGAVDVAGDPGELSDDPWEGRPSGLQSFVKQARAFREHPLALAGLNGATADSILHQLCQQVPLLHHRGLEQPPLILPTDLGTFKSTSLCQRSQKNGHLPGMKDGRVGVVGIKGYPQYDCQMLASSYALHAARGGIVLETLGLEVQVIALRGNELMHPAEMAAKLEQESTLQRLTDDLSQQASSRRLTHLILPPVMGLNRWQEVQAILGRLSIQVAEMLASPPSVPGLRLQRALDAAIFKQDIVLLRDQVTGHVSDQSNKRIIGIKLAGGDMLEADAFVLATGKFIGQGLTHHDTLRETIFDLPVWIGGEGPNPRHLGKQMNRSVKGPHPLMSAGIQVDQTLRPLSGWRNLYAAGSIIGGYDYIMGRCGLGTALLTGHLAGTAAAGGAP